MKSEIVSGGQASRLGGSGMAADAPLEEFPRPRRNPSYIAAKAERRVAGGPFQRLRCRYRSPTRAQTCSARRLACGSVVALCSCAINRRGRESQTLAEPRVLESYARSGALTIRCPSTTMAPTLLQNLPSALQAAEMLETRQAVFRGGGRPPSDVVRLPHRVVDSHADQNLRLPAGDPRCEHEEVSACRRRIHVCLAHRPRAARLRTRGSSRASSSGRR